MSDGAGNKYGLKVVAGGVAPLMRRRSPRGTRAQLDLDERMRRAFRDHAVSPTGRVVSRAVQDINDGRQKPWASIGRRAEELHEAGANDGFLKIVSELVEWFEAHFNRRPAA